MLLGPVEGLKEGDDVSGVRLLRRREAALVHAVVDLVVLPLVRRVDLLAEALGVQVERLVLVGDKVVELFGPFSKPISGQDEKDSRASSPQC